MQGIAYGIDVLSTRACQDSDCSTDHGSDPIYVSPTCHPHAAMWGVYVSGTFVLVCSACNSAVAALAVAEESRDVEVDQEVLDVAGK